VGEATDAPIMVLVYRQQADGVHVIGSSVLHSPGQYAVAVPAGVYRVAAFQDGNGDRRYDAGHEPAAFYHGGQTVAVMPRQRVDRVYLTLRRDQPQPIELELALPEDHRDGSRSGVDQHPCGTS